jgi:hypothetical protein
MDKVRLKLIGITYNQIESGVYALILQQYDGTRRIPIIIGYPEAQAIECKLQDVVTPRPLTHDLMVNAFDAFGIRLEEINIRKLQSGIFAATLMLRHSNGELKEVDARSSDAIALAIRVDAPIYTTPEVLEESGFEPDDRQRRPITALRVSPKEKPEPKQAKPAGKSIEEMDSDELLEAMKAAAEEENYEEAARIKAEIFRREQEGGESETGTNHEGNNDTI